MLALGKLLELTLAGREPTEKIQLTPAGVRLHWLAERAPETAPAPRPARPNRAGRSGPSRPTT
mgnify:CR=1 FL=1